MNKVIFDVSVFTETYIHHILSKLKKAFKKTNDEIYIHKVFEYTFINFKIKKILETQDDFNVLINKILKICDIRQKINFSYQNESITLVNNPNLNKMIERFDYILTLSTYPNYPKIPYEPLEKLNLDYKASFTIMFPDWDIRLDN